MKRIAVPLAVLSLTAAVFLGVIAQDKPVAVESSASAASDAAAAPAQAASAPAEAAAEPKEVVCFESRDGATQVTQRELQPGWPNVKCSPSTGAALWYGDPYDRAVPMGKMPLMEELPPDQAVVVPRTPQMKFIAQCGTACHNGTYPKGFPKDNRPVPMPTMEAMMPELKEFRHGRGAIWCLDCHHKTQRNMLVNHFGEPIGIEQPQLLCGKCHGDKLRDWRDGIHGKRIGDFTSEGKKRWFTCTECHNPHDVQDGTRDRGFVALKPEPPPQLPRGFRDAAHEKVHPIPH